jgi:hypothetical protein
MIAARHDASMRPLIRLFLRRFTDNDLLSSHGDQHAGPIMVLAAATAASVFMAVLVGLNRFGMYPRVAVLAFAMLEDRFFLISLAMILMALVTVTGWEALSLDYRDAAVLGPLPLERERIVRAKACAVFLWASGMAMALVLPGVLYPLIATINVRMPAPAVLRIVAAQLAGSAAGVAATFLAVLGVRETARVLLPARYFNRVIPIVQSALVVCLVTALLLLLGGLFGSAASSFTEAGAGRGRLVMPPLWFLAMAEVISANAAVGGNPPPAAGSWVGPADWLIDRYRGYEHVFASGSSIALWALAGALVLCSLCYAWNNRSLPEHAPASPTRRCRWLHRLLATTIVRHPVARAGFFFTVRTLLGSVPHRLTLAFGVAAAVATTAATVGFVTLEHPHSGRDAPLSLWMLQTLVIVALSAALHRAMRLPAELRARWMITLCWPEEPVRFLRGVRYAAMTALMLPAVLLLLPLHVVTLGPGAAVMHALNGALLASFVLALMIDHRAQFPFTVSFVAQSTLGNAAPVVVLATLAVASTLALIERAMMFVPVFPGPSFVLLLALAASSLVTTRRPPLREAPADLPDTLQTLGLHG